MKSAKQSPGATTNSASRLASNSSMAPSSQTSTKGLMEDGVADRLGLPVPQCVTGLVNRSIPERKVAVLAADGVSGSALEKITAALRAEGAVPVLVAPRDGFLKTDAGKEIKIDASLLNTGSVLYDAVYLPGGDWSVASLLGEPRAIRFVKEAFGHAKALGASGMGIELLNAAGAHPPANSRAGRPAPGVVLGDESPSNDFAKQFIAAIAADRHWERGAQAPALERPRD